MPVDDESPFLSVDDSLSDQLGGPGSDELAAASAAPAAPPPWPAGAGEMARLIRGFDWSGTPLGPLADWPQSLLTAVDMLLRLPLPAALHWGRDGITLYNDAYAIFAGDLHPALLGQPLRASWPGDGELGATVLVVGLSGGSLSYRDHELTVPRNGVSRQARLNLTYAPVLDESGRPGGVLALMQELAGPPEAGEPSAPPAHAQEPQPAPAALASVSREAPAVQPLQLERLRVLEQTVRQAPAFMFLLRGADLVFELANDACYRLFGQRKLVGRPISEVLPEASRDGTQERIARVLATAAPVAGRALPFALARTPGGPPEQRLIDFIYQPICDADGRCTHVLGQGLDVTEHVRERRRAEERLGRQARLLTATHDALVAVDEHDLITFWNPAAEHVFGWPAAEALGRRADDIICPMSVEVAQGLGEQRAEAFRRGQPLRGELLVQREDGSGVWVEQSVSAQVLPDGRPAGYVASYREIGERKLALAPRQQQPEPFQLALEASGIVAYEWDVEQNITRFSALGQDWYGFTEGTGQQVASFVHPGDMPGHLEHLRRALESGEPLETEYREVRPDGSLRWISAHARRIDQGRPKMFGILMDITARKRAEAERERLLAQAQADYEQKTAILDAIGDVCYVLDENFSFTYANYKAEEVFGRWREELVGRHYWSEFPNVVGSETYAMHLKAVDEGRPIHYELSSPRHGWLEFSIYPAPRGGLCVFARDINQRKQIEDALRDSEERLRQTFERVSDYAIITTDAEGMIESWNVGAERMFGYDEGEARDRHIELLYMYDDRLADVPGRQMSQALERGRALEERWHVRRDGVPLYISGTLAPLRDGATVTGYILIARDLTDQRRAEEDLRRAHDELVQEVGALAQQIEELRRELDDVSLGLPMQVDEPEPATWERDPSEPRVSDHDAPFGPRDGEMGWSGLHAAWEPRPETRDDQRRPGHDEGAGPADPRGEERERDRYRPVEDDAPSQQDDPRSGWHAPGAERDWPYDQRGEDTVEPTREAASRDPASDAPAAWDDAAVDPDMPDEAPDDHGGWFGHVRREPESAPAQGRDAADEAPGHGVDAPDEPEANQRDAAWGGWFGYLRRERGEEPAPAQGRDAADEAPGQGVDALDEPPAPGERDGARGGWFGRQPDADEAAPAQVGPETPPAAAPAEGARGGWLGQLWPAPAEEPGHSSDARMPPEPLVDAAEDAQGADEDDDSHGAASQPTEWGELPPGDQLVAHDASRVLRDRYSTRAADEHDEEQAQAREQSADAPDSASGAEPDHFHQAFGWQTDDERRAAQDDVERERQRSTPQQDRPGERDHLGRPFDWFGADASAGEAGASGDQDLARGRADEGERLLQELLADDASVERDQPDEAGAAGAPGPAPEQDHESTEERPARRETRAPHLEALTYLGLADVLRQHAQDWAADSGVVVDVHLRGLDYEELPAEVEATVVRVVYEALENVWRHADASRVLLFVELRGDELRAIVEDNGRGFELELVEQREPAGLARMRALAGQVGGRIDVEAERGVGTTIYLRVPIL